MKIHKVQKTRKFTKCPSQGPWARAMNRPEGQGPMTIGKGVEMANDKGQGWIAASGRGHGQQARGNGQAYA